MALNLSRLESIIAGLPGAVDRGNHRAATYVKDLAVQLAPEDSGALKASGRVDPERPDGSGQARVVFGGGAVTYARVVEQGNPDQPNYPAQPYLRPAQQAIDLKREILAELRALLRGGS